MCLWAIYTSPRPSNQEQNDRAFRCSDLRHSEPRPYIRHIEGYSVDTGAYLIRIILVASMVDQKCLMVVDVLPARSHTVLYVTVLSSVEDRESKDHLLMSQAILL